MSFLFRILAALLLAATLLAAGDERAESARLPRLELFPVVALAPGAGGAARGRELGVGDRSPPHLAYAVWEELGRSILEAAEAAPPHPGHAPLELDGTFATAPLPSLASARSAGETAGEPAPAAAPAAVAEVARERERAERPRLDLNTPHGLYTPEVDGVRGFLELHLVGDLGVSFGFSVEF